MSWQVSIQVFIFIATLKHMKTFYMNPILFHLYCGLNFWNPKPGEVVCIFFCPMQQQVLGYRWLDLEIHDFPQSRVEITLCVCVCVFVLLDIGALGYAFFQVLRFSSVSVISPTLHIHSTPHHLYIILAHMDIKSGTVSCKIEFILNVCEYLEKFINSLFRCYEITAVLSSDIPSWQPVTGRIAAFRLEFLSEQIFLRMWHMLHWHSCVQSGWDWETLSFLWFELGRTRISFISVLYQHFSLLVFKISGWSILK